jgi:hypothetical protein
VPRRSQAQSITETEAGAQSQDDRLQIWEIDGHISESNALINWPQAALVSPKVERRQNSIFYTDLKPGETKSLEIFVSRPRPCVKPMFRPFRASRLIDNSYPGLRLAAGEASPWAIISRPFRPLLPDC